MKFILFVGAAQSFFWMFLIFKKPQKQLAGLLLLLSMFVAGTFILIDFLQETSYNYKALPHLPFFNNCIPLLFGPLMLLYIQHHGRKKATQWLHFLPFLIVLSINLPLLIKSPEELLLIISQLSESALPLQFRIQEIMIVASGVVYVVWCWKALKEHQNRVCQEFSNT